jgi:hypothetical protein
MRKNIKPVFLVQTHTSITIQQLINLIDWTQHNHIYTIYFESGLYYNSFEKFLEPEFLKLDGLIHYTYKNTLSYHKLYEAYGLVRALCGYKF